MRRDVTQIVSLLITHPIASEHRWLVKAPGWIHSARDVSGQAVLMLRLQCAIVESTRRHKHVPFVNIASLRSIKRRQWKHNLDYYGVVFAHLATGVGLMRKSPRGWIQIGESHTRGVARIPPGLKPSRDSRATSQRNSPIWIQPLGVFRYTRNMYNLVKLYDEICRYNGWLLRITE